MQVEPLKAAQGQGIRISKLSCRAACRSGALRETDVYRIAMLLETLAMLLLGAGAESALVEMDLRYPLGDQVFAEGFIV
jgi:hypothetical protein